MKKIFTCTWMFLTLFSASWAQNNGTPGLVPDNDRPIFYRIPEGYSEGVHYVPKAIIFKLEPDAADALLPSSPLGLYLQRIGAQTEPLFPQARPPRRKTDDYGRKLVDLTRIYISTYSAGIPVREVMETLKKTGVMEYVQPKMIVGKSGDDKVLLTPNDPDLPLQWHINKINAPQAWDVNSGDPSVVVAITDGGTNLFHPDLANIAYNILDPIDGVDNDGDGWVDNYRGWNTGSNNNNPQFDVGGGANHGVAVTGVASATANNNVNGAGVGYNCRYLPVKIADGAGQYSGAEPGIFYAAEKGAKVINCSWGGNNPWPLLEDVTRYAVINKGCYLVASAGNSNNNAPYWPAAYDWVTCVAGSNVSDIKSSTSSYYEFVDITAPGEDIYTTSMYSFGNVGVGTSWAAPVVSGAAALVKSQFPSYTPEQIGALLKETSFDLYTLPGNSAYLGKLGRGRLDIGAALTTVPGPSVKMITRNWTDGNDGLFTPGENVSLSGNFVNWLNPSSPALRCTLTTGNPNVTIIDSVVTIGVLANLAVYNNAPAPFTVHINAGCPVNTNVLFKLKLSDGTYADKQFFSLLVNANFLNLTENRVHTSIGSIGRIGYMDDNSQYGLGLSKDGNLQHLVVSSFMLADSPTRVSDAGIGPTVNPFSNDFTPVTPARPVPPTVSDFDAQGSFNDNNAGANRLNILTAYKAWAWNDPANENFVILEYTLKNTGGAALSNLFSGIYSFWEMPNAQFYSSVYMANWDAARKLGYGYNAQAPNGSFAGMKLLSYDPVSWYAFNNNGVAGSINLYDGFSEAEKFAAMSNGVSRPAAVPGTISGLLSTGPLAIPAGDSVKVAFALVLGDDLASLQAAADAAQVKYDGLHATWTGSLSTDWNTPGNWFPGQVPDHCATDVNIPLTANQPFVNGTDITVGNLTVADGVVIGIQNGRTLNVCQNIRAGNGSGCTVSGGRLRLMGTALQGIAGKIRATFARLDNAAGAEIVSTASFSLDSGMELKSGQLTVNGQFTLLSDAAGTAYLDDFGTGFTGTVQGSIHVQRYNPTGMAGYRQLGTPVQLPNIGALAGFTPSGTPGFVIPLPTCDPNFTDAGSPYGNWMQFVENGTVQYACAQSLFEILTTGGMTAGRGYYLDVPGNSTLTFRGVPNTGPVSFGVTHANGPVTGGWNQVSNPYPSPLRWEPTDVPAGLDAIGKIWITSGTYMGTFQDLDPNMTGIQSVAIGQAFQVRVSVPGAAVPFAVDNTSRTTVPPTYLFAGGDAMTLNIDLIGGTFADLAKIRFIDGATDQADALYDSPKLFSPANQPMVYSIWNSARYSTNSFGGLGTAYTIPLGVRTPQAGAHTFHFTNMDQFPASAFVYLEDTQHPGWQDIRINETYAFTTTGAADENRFKLHFYPPFTIETVAATCQSQGTATLTETGPAAWNYTLLDPLGHLTAQGQWDGTLALDHLYPGTYTLQLTEQNSGYTLEEQIVVTGVGPVTATASASTLQAAVGQQIQFTAQSAQATDYQWNFGDLHTAAGINTSHAYNAAGTYPVTLTASDGGCSATSQLTVVIAGHAGITDASTANGVDMWNDAGSVYLRFAEAWPGKTVFTLYDMGGKQVLQKQVNPVQGTVAYDITPLAAGAYTAELQGKNQTVRRKMMKGM